MIIALIRPGLTAQITKHDIILRGLDDNGRPILLWLNPSELAVINRCVEDSLKEKDNAE